MILDNFWHCKDFLATILISLSFSRIEINKPLPAPVDSFVGHIKIQKAILVVAANRCLISLTVDCSIISIDSDIIDNTNREVIDVYSRKRVKPRMESSQTPTLNRHSCNFPSRTTWNCLSLRKDKIGPKTWLKFRNTVTAGVAQVLLKALRVLSNTTVRSRQLIEEIWNYTWNHKRDYISRGDKTQNWQVNA